MIKLLQDGDDYTAALQRALDSKITFDVGSGSLVLEVFSKKPLSQLFFDVVSAHDCDELTVETWNGSAYVSVDELADNTAFLTRYGFIAWENPEGIAVDPDEDSLYKYRFTISGGTVGDPVEEVDLDLRYVGIVFSQMNDMKVAFPIADDYIPAGDQSNIRFVVAAKDDIVQHFRNSGKNVLDVVASRDLTEFDFNDPAQLKQASTYLSLAKLCESRSDAVDDKWDARAKNFMAKYGSAIQLFFVSLDTNGDGKTDPDEREWSVNSGVLVRV